MLVSHPSSGQGWRVPTRHFRSRCSGEYLPNLRFPRVPILPIIRVEKGAVCSMSCELTFLVVVCRDPRSYSNQAGSSAENPPNPTCANRFENIGKVRTHYDPEIRNQTGRSPETFSYATGTGATLARVGKFSKRRAILERVAIACGERVGLKESTAGSVIESRILFPHPVPRASLN